MEPSQHRGDWVDQRSIQRLVERAVRHPKAPPEECWPEPGDAVLGRHWALADHDWHRRRTRTVGAEEVEEVDDHVTRYALTPDGRLVRADRTRSAIGPGTAPARWRSEVRTLTPRDVRTLDRRPVRSAVQHGTMSTWGTQPTGEPFLAWPGSGLELLLKALIA